MTHLDKQFHRNIVRYITVYVTKTLYEIYCDATDFYSFKGDIHPYLVLDIAF